MIVDDLILEKCIGNGKRGEVYLTTKKGDNSNKYATKKIKKDNEKLKDINNEKEILKEIGNENIIRIYEIKENKQYYFIVKEYCNGLSLKDCLEQYKEKYGKPFSLEINQHIIRQVLECVNYIHNKYFIHRDLNMKNILVIFETEEDKNNINMIKAKIKINDFYKATRYTRSPHKTIIGSSSCPDPVTIDLLKNKDNAGYNENFDIWSVGNIFYQILTGNHLIHAKNKQELIKHYESGLYTLPININKETIFFITSMLRSDPYERTSAKDLLNHPFLVKNVKDFERINIIKLKDNIGKNGLNVNFLTNSITYQVDAIKNNDSNNLCSYNSQDPIIVYNFNENKNNSNNNSNNGD